MSLKRVLNPYDYDDFYYQRQHSVAWDGFGNPIEDFPLLQNQSWTQCLGEVFPGSNDALLDNLDSVQDGDITLGSLSIAQEQLGQWAADGALWRSNGLEMVEDQVLKEPVNGAEQICFGMIFRASLKLLGDGIELQNKLESYADCRVPGHCQLQIFSDRDRLLARLGENTVIGELDGQVKKALSGLLNEVEMDGFALVKAIYDSLEKSGKDAVVRINIDIYGPRRIIERVGSELSQGKIYLQRPDYFRPGFLYENPHFLNLLGLDDLTIDPALQDDQEDEEDDNTESFKKTVSNIYSSLTRDKSLEGIEGDNHLKTRLLKHQEKALAFMTQREDGSIPDRYRLWKAAELNGFPCYRHEITNLNSRTPPTETGGGILADEMGMGKSLSTLALISRTLDAARDWASESAPDAYQMRKLKATLIIASSDLMINEWFQELEKHFFNSNSSHLSAFKYHGQRRLEYVKKLYECDIVLTTYHTLASDFKSPGNPFNHIEFYRVVLDEAHYIRRQSNVFYRSVSNLRARSRWCLTGTPIQNRLEDIGCLFAFLKISPFQNLSVFKKYFVQPFELRGEPREKSIAGFTRLLDSLCLRRTTEGENIVLDRNDIVRTVNLSVDERRQYESTKEIMVQAIRNQGGELDSHSALSLFQVQLQLRILCNHGTWQQPFAWTRRKLNSLDESEAAIELTLDGSSEVTCSACSEKFPTSGSGSEYHRYTLKCLHILCSRCLETGMPTGQDRVPETCPLCRLNYSTNSYLQRPGHRAEIEHYFQSQGHSSKMEALMNDVLPHFGTTKSIIFSCWTHTLDLIQIYLRRAGLEDRRILSIDGECTTKKRERILYDFENDPGMRLLIMTFGTGAVGLNLATANRVFIVEPQWNPSVENQAIARALRLGQKQSVQVTRYIVEKTVEQDMRALQDKKLELASVTNFS